MPSRLTQKLSELRQQNRKAFGAYIMAGDPDLKTTEDLILTLEKSGASFVELGLPFSDPMADGPIIQRAHERALKNKVTLENVFELVASVRQKSQIPILLMGYYNPVLQFGLKRFALAAKQCGVDAVLLVDLPMEQAKPLQDLLTPHDVDLIFLVTPNSTPERIKNLQTLSSGFVYYVSLTGVTGAKSLDPKSVAQQLSRLRQKIKLPILVGFGISRPEHVQAVAASADGVIVGSAILDQMEKNPNQVEKSVFEFVRSLVGALPKSVQS